MWRDRMETSMNALSSDNFDSAKIIPSILTDSQKTFFSDLSTFSELDPQPEIIQLDVIDGIFAPELTVEPSILNQDLVVSTLDAIQVDLHLMTVDPIDYVHEVYENQSVRAVIAQIEKIHSLTEFLEEVKANHLLAGFALDVYTPFESIDQAFLPELKVVQIMGGQAGSQGQTFAPQIIEKIKAAQEAREALALDYEIYVDIGMNPTTIPQAKQAGADGFVVGSYLQKENPQLAWEELNQALENERE